ncbi:hypothetical protein IT087_00995 [Candidatus Uhrbacteria bacterium]|nr:hypothetical protein [Candidatus Uhrbacteria bacterium]
MINLRSRARLVAPVIALVLLGQGCLGGSSNKATGPDGGIFRTADGGDTWRQLQVINIGSKRASIANMGIVTMAADPQDVNTLYAGTTENGVIFSNDGGESWQPATGLSVGRVNAIAVDSKSKCTVYATIANQIMKTTTCSRDWTRIYYDPRTDKSFTTLVSDWYNPNVVYAGTNDGDILRSDNAGESWRVVHRVEGVRVNQLVMDPRDSRVLYGATQGAGLVKTTDGGQTWTSIRKEFEGFENARRPNLIVLDPNNANRVYTISKYGILQSDNGGSSWTALKLPTPPGTVEMKAMAVHPKDAKRIVYATNKAVIWSVDGGTTWTTKKLPTARGAAFMLYNKAETPALFLGASPPPSN